MPEGGRANDLCATVILTTSVGWMKAVPEVRIPVITWRCSSNTVPLQVSNSTASLSSD
uniref:Uncharacterized protein n=1 Tax=Nelumbo nucifera TaxID=4432 RepID=A0A822XDT3_NELNU|nr:TPA_asm: hypothetical protein HUJ06_019953 [Nelumbo nucifera]